MCLGSVQVSHACSSARPAHHRGDSSSPWGSAGRICRQGHATPVCHSVEPPARALLFSAPRASACWLQSAAFVQLQKQYLVKHPVREIWFYLTLNLMKTLTNMGFCSVIWTPSPGMEVLWVEQLWHLSCQLGCHCSGHSDTLETPQSRCAPVRGGRWLFWGTHLCRGQGAADTPPPSDELTLPSISPDLFSTLSIAKLFWLWRKDIRRRTKNLVSCEHFSTLQGSKCCTDIYLNAETFSELL